MILSGPGVFVLRAKPGDSLMLDWASVSAKQPSFIRVWYGEMLVEDAFIGAYSPHTWWLGNDLLGRQRLQIGSLLKIELGDGLKMRIEGDLEQVN